MTYHSLLPIDRRIAYRGLIYTVKALWDKGVVCVTDGGVRKIITGKKNLEEVRRAI